MKNSTLTIWGVVALLGGLFVFYLDGPPEQELPEQESTVLSSVQEATTSFQNLEPKTDDQSAVAVTVTPINISPKSKEWQFNISMETHSVELDQDLVKTAILVDEEGREYKPLTWKGPVGGHHREGVLIFDRIAPIPKLLELKISSIEDIERTFSWQIK